MAAIGPEKPEKPEQPEKNNGFRDGQATTTRKTNEIQWFSCWLNLDEVKNHRKPVVFNVLPNGKFGEPLEINTGLSAGLHVSLSSHSACCVDLASVDHELQRGNMSIFLIRYILTSYGNRP